ncbi:MAG: hypothetical protein ACRDBG_14885 [Waterburya sp.]
MLGSEEVISNGNIDLADILVNIRLTNVTEIKIIQEIINYLDTQYHEHKNLITISTVAALILNRSDIPNLYATSPRGYNNQMLRFQNQFGIYGVKVREELIPWAIEQILRQGLLQNLNQNSTLATKTTESQIISRDKDILEILTQIDLINVTELEVIKATVSYIHFNYPEAVGRINLSDICALILNHEVVSSLYATSPEECNLLTQTYLSQYQPQVNEIVEQMVAKVHAEGLEPAFSLDSIIAANHQRRKKLTKSWQA